MSQPERDHEPHDEGKPAMGLGMRRFLMLSPLAVFVAIAGVFFWGLDPGRDPRYVPTTMLEKEIPAFEYPAVEGLDRAGFSNADLGDGEITVVNFFASWCVPCRIEHPLLERLAKDEGLRLYGVSHRDKAADALRFLKELGNPYHRVGADPGRGAIDWGVYGLPETFIVDGAGKIRYHHRGPLTEKLLQIEFLPIIEALRG